MPDDTGWDSGAIPRISGRILVVDDVATNQLLLANRLGRAGANVSVAGNGLEALELVRSSWEAQERFDVILMDLQMPKMDGLTATREIRKNADSTPIIAITARHSESAREQAASAGCNEYVTKPVHWPDLFAVLEKYLPRGEPS